MNSILNRRQLLPSDGLILLLSRLNSAVKVFAKGEQILVLGAGMAGISAARTLVDKGCSVTLLEARDVANAKLRGASSPSSKTRTQSRTS